MGQLLGRLLSLGLSDLSSNLGLQCFIRLLDDSCDKCRAPRPSARSQRLLVLLSFFYARDSPLFQVSYRACLLQCVVERDEELLLPDSFTFRTIFVEKATSMRELCHVRLLRTSCAR